MQNSLQERQVSADAFLVSKTDTKGKITYCNIPFAQIVGAKGNELIGKPHNIVRHPDMPRVVFKILWEYVKNKKEVFAYVKNKSLDGSFYWVFANVTASLDQSGNIIGYYSVRRKPNPKALEVIIPLYRQLLEAEKSGGLEASSRLLESVLQKKNKSYDELMNDLQRL
ncbi:PAS domain-containing protein [Campylobacter showae]|jgi:methyl-accepting chemotaxis protein|uniref:Signal transduction protein CetB, mediates an energy taxis response n=2 Tax=Campylobacter showae TaxID=204 RepID=M5IQY6_9BACT|nr:PAS domain-containing protein [Campylobacter showae]EKU11764.1 Signal transduction protein CetB, mediates an energy taxis response [Campylobacter showae CSUNSWCD]